MRDEHIVSGDYVLVERTCTAREGEIIVALIDGADATLKRFYREGTMVRLQLPEQRDGPHLRPRNDAGNSDHHNQNGSPQPESKTARNRPGPSPE